MAPAPPKVQPNKVTPTPLPQLSKGQPHSIIQPSFSKKIPRRSSKPIINWFQRKLAGTVKPRRVSDGSPGLPSPSDTGPARSKSRTSTTGQVKTRSTRSVSSPWPQPSRVSSQRNGNGNTVQGRRLGDESVPQQRRTLSISLNGDGEFDNVHLENEPDTETSTTGSSFARDSMWSPTSALEADEDASVRPLPPSTPPSPSLSYSSSSYMSNSRTFRSMAASTKPTTVLSIDLAPAGIGHIAQVPATPISQMGPRIPPHMRSSSTGTSGGLVGSGASITFSALPPSPQSSRTPSLTNHVNGPPSNSTMHGLQAPLHTAHHPRNNPRPASPPMDNASVLTLASSAYAIPGGRMTLGSVASAALSAMGLGDSVSHLGGSIGEGEPSFLTGDDDRIDVDGDRDVDASLRALRPRSSRKSSWDSEASGWSAKILGTGVGSKSLRTSYSVKTSGYFTAENADTEISQTPFTTPAPSLLC